MKEKKKKEFSKVLMIQESILLWIITLSFIVLAFICVSNQYFGELPWLAAIATCPWAAYSVGQGFYYKNIFFIVCETLINMILLLKFN